MATDIPQYPAPGSEIPGQPGYVVGQCGHRLAVSEWRAGFRTCERCPATQQTAAEPPTEAVEELVELMYQADILDGSEWAADRAASIARALLKAGVRLPAETPGGGA